jgi:catechol 2,3-dioxygenase-like lactoylglutathione lyase family enzyme
MTLPGQITGVHTVGVPVTDQDRAIDFYVGTLGFSKRPPLDRGGARWFGDNGGLGRRGVARGVAGGCRAQDVTGGGGAGGRRSVGERPGGLGSRRRGAR